MPIDPTEPTSTDTTRPRISPHHGAIRVQRFDGQSSYLFPIDGVREYWPAEDGRLSFVRLSMVKEPILVAGTVAQLDAAFAQAALCPISAR